MALTQWARMLKRGDLSDIEDWRATHRLGVARGILRNLGIEPTFREHTEECPRHPDNLRRVVFSYRDGVCCNCGASQAWAEWPEWVTDDIFEAAINLAHHFQEERGAYNRRQAWEGKQERERKAREERQIAREEADLGPTLGGRPDKASG